MNFLDSAYLHNFVFNIELKRRELEQQNLTRSEDKRWFEDNYRVFSKKSAFTCLCCNKPVNMNLTKDKGTCYMPKSDDDGIDLIINKKGDFKPIFIQVKSRFKLNKGKPFIQNVGCATFKSRAAFYIIFIYFNEGTFEVECVWLVPYVKFEELAYLKKSGENYKSFYRFSANPHTEARVEGNRET